MAIITTAKPTQYNIGATYWRAIRQNADFINVGATIIMGGYVDRNQREGGDPIAHHAVIVSREDYMQAVFKQRKSENTYDSMFAAIYELAMADPFFVDGIEG